MLKHFCRRWCYCYYYHYYYYYGGWKKSCTTYTHCFEYTFKQQPRAPFLTLTLDFFGAVQDLCHWNDFVKPRVHSNVMKGARGEATYHSLKEVQDFLHPQFPKPGLALACSWLAYMACGYFPSGLSFWLSPTTCTAPAQLAPGCPTEVTANVHSTLHRSHS